MFTGIALTTEKKRLARLADTLEARQKELTIKEDLCDRLTTKLKAAEAAMIAREGERAALEDTVREYKNELVTLTAELAPVRAEHAAKTAEIKAADDRIARAEQYHDERVRKAESDADDRVAKVERDSRERAREREDAENAAADAAVARARQAIADVDERTRAAEKKFAEFERDHAVKVSKMEHEAAENARRLEAKLL